MNPKELNRQASRLIGRMRIISAPHGSMHPYHDVIAALYVAEKKGDLKELQKLIKSTEKMLKEDA